MAINYPQRYDDDFLNTIKTVIDHVNVHGKTIQDLVAEGQLTEEQYADLIRIINGLIKSGTIKESDLGSGLKSLLNNLESGLETERQRINNLSKLNEGSTTGDAELIDGRVGIDGITYDNIGEAIRTQLTRLNDGLEDASVKFSYPFSAEVTTPEIKNFITDIYSNAFGSFDEYSLRFADETSTDFGLILYGWSNSQKEIVGRATIEKATTLSSVPINRAGYRGEVAFDVTYMNDVISVMPQVVGEIDGFPLNESVKNKNRMSRELNALETRMDLENVIKKDSYFIDDASISDEGKSLFDDSVENLKIYCKKNVRNIALHRNYINYERRVVDFSYIKSGSGELGNLNTNIYDPSYVAQKEKIELENDDLYIFMVIDWEKSGVVKNSGAYNYQESGISLKNIIDINEYNFLKGISGGGAPSQVISDNIGTELIVCGADATPYQLSVGNAMQDLGYGYVCNQTELDEGVNNFIDSFMDSEVTIKFFGTIRTSKGIHKHPRHNLVGYNATLKSGDNLGQDYWTIIFPTSGGVTFEESQVISHGRTFVKGFNLDGNCQNNMKNGEYDYRTYYGGAISHEIFNDQTPPFTRTQLCTDIIVEDIKIDNSMRGMIAGIGWICKNIDVGDAVNDHALYLAGADQSYVENFRARGFHKRGALAIASMSFDEGRRVRNVTVKNMFIDESTGTHGPFLSVRGVHSSVGNVKPLGDLFIDGLYIKKTDTPINSALAVMVGTPSHHELDKEYELGDYPTNIHINNFVADMNLSNSLFVFSNANIIMKDASIRIHEYNYSRPLFRLQSTSELKKVFDFSGTRITFEGPESTNALTLFGIQNNDSAYNEINGLNLNDVIIEGISNYYLFGRVGDTDTNLVTLKNVSSERLSAHPLGTIKPQDESYINIVSDDYYVL